MDAFCQKHATKIAGVLSCFDRMLFRGYLPIMSGASMAQFLQSERVNCEYLKRDDCEEPVRELSVSGSSIVSWNSSRSSAV
jgi:hypothetical protein